MEARGAEVARAARLSLSAMSAAGGRCKQDREGRRAGLRQYASARDALITFGDGWWLIDDEDDWTAMLLGRWPVLGEEFVRGRRPASPVSQPTACRAASCRTGH